MEKIDAEYFEDEVLICGCTAQDNLYYKRLYKAFQNNGVKVLAMPTMPPTQLGFSTYDSLDALPGVPKCAFILSENSDTPDVIEKLAALGVKKVLFWGAADAPESIMALCESKGIAVRIGCPLMLYASGFCWLHGKFSGVRRAKKKTA